MRLHNIRRKHATNSSSSHSIVLAKGQSLPIPPRDENDPDFGWEPFVLHTSDDKRLYMATQLYGNAKRRMSSSNALALVWGATGVRVDVDAGIDHQSQMDLPLEYGGKGIDLEFFGELLTAVLREDCLILGGNDNEEVEWHAEYGSPIFQFLPRDWCDVPVARKDERFGTWTIFSPSAGEKIRFSFSDQTDPGRTSTPELVDLKITDYCNQGCGFCYQNSSADGEHAQLYLYRLADALQELRVFEVAIGGGEPTTHPKFAELLRRLKGSGIVPNFSTRDLSWMQDHKKREEILQSTGAFAYSARTPQEVAAFGQLVHSFDVPRYDRGETSYQNETGNAHVQVIPEIIPYPDMCRILEEAREAYLTVTLLGFKTAGRGATYAASGRQTGNETWVKAIYDTAEKGGCPNIGIDTVLAYTYKAALKEMGVPDYTYYVTEGAFSMYLDAVTGHAGPSSFCSPEELVKVDMRSYRLEEQLQDAFDGWQRPADWFVRHHWKNSFGGTMEGPYTTREEAEAERRRLLAENPSFNVQLVCCPKEG